MRWYSLMIWLGLLFFIEAQGSAFEENGVKEGNVKFSIGFDDDQLKGEKASRKFYASYGDFIRDDLELFLKLKYSSEVGADSCFLEVGGSYYFLKGLTYTPYVGYGVGLECVNTQGGIADEEDAFIGLHNFLSEQIAISSEFGVDFYNVTSYLGRYMSVNLTYFFSL